MPVPDILCWLYCCCSASALLRGLRLLSVHLESIVVCYLSLLSFPTVLLLLFSEMMLPSTDVAAAVCVLSCQAAIRSGGMFRVAKVDAEKQKGIAEVLGIKAFPSIFGVKDGIILDNFVGVLPQDEVCKEGFVLSPFPVDLRKPVSISSGRAFCCFSCRFRQSVASFFGRRCVASIVTVPRTTYSPGVAPSAWVSLGGDNTYLPRHAHAKAANTLPSPQAQRATPTTYRPPLEPLSSKAESADQTAANTQQNLRQMQAFMMGVVMGVPPPKDKELREHQKGQSELRGISRKLAHVSGLSSIVFCHCFRTVRCLAQTAPVRKSTRAKYTCGRRVLTLFRLRGEPHVRNSRRALGACKRPRWRPSLFRCLCVRLAPPISRPNFLFLPPPLGLPLGLLLPLPPSPPPAPALPPSVTLNLPLSLSLTFSNSLSSPGLAVLGSRKKESLCIKVDKALSEMLTTPEGSTPATEDPAAVAAAKKAARTVITVLMSAYKFPEVGGSSKGV